MKINLATIYQSLPESDASVVIAKFEEQNRCFKYYVADVRAQDLYVACYNSLKQCFVDNGDNKSVEDAYIYKMMFLFQADNFDPVTTLTNFDKFAKTNINGIVSLKAFLSRYRTDAFDFPQNQEYASFDYDVEAMRKALPTVGHSLLKNIDHLREMQASNGGVFPQDVPSFKQAALKVKFPNAERNMKLAELCNLYDGNNQQFSDMISLMQNGTLPSAHGTLIPKPVDNLPNVMVKYINPETGSNYHLVKEPSHDLRTMMLGNITGNCQTFQNGDADAFIIDGITRANNGFYVIIKQSKKAFDPGNIDWDNLENNGSEITPKILEDEPPLQDKKQEQGTDKV